METTGMTFTLTRRGLIQLLAATPLAGRARAGEAWDGIVAEARGQTVYFNAWAGSPQINAYIAWVGEALQRRHDITLEHVKLADTAEAVRRVRDEVTAGRAGSADLLWINGENFRVMKAEKLLFGPFAEDLPNLELARSAPGRITYPAPPDFHGTTFIKQALAETMADRALLPVQIGRQAFTEAAKPLFEFLDALHPELWRNGKQFPQTQAQMTQMLADGELLVGLTFNPNEPANLVATGTLPSSTIAWQNRGGTIGNTHFVAIPINSTARQAAQVTANFLLSPEAQARKADLAIWGDPTVLDMAKLTPEDRALFTSAAAPGSVTQPAPAIPEPHGSWVPLIEAAWLERYGA
jgi:putative thiamine transport system substrate-binding protein